MDDHACHECGAPLSMKAHEQTTKVGRYRVKDASCRVLVCVNGHPEIDLEMLAGYERRAAAIVLTDVGDLGGEEIKFARKAIGLTQAQLAVLLGVERETVSRWEGGKPVERTTRLALLAIVRDPEGIERAVEHPAPLAKVLEVSAEDGNKDRPSNAA